jgi:hypothetical protein
MRALQMLGVAAQAEGLRLRREVAGTARQAGWFAGASLFGAAAVATAHVTAVAYLAPEFGLATAAAMVAGADLLIAGMLVLLGRRRRDPIPEEARRLRESMLASLTQRDAVQDVLSLALRAGSGPLIGAVTGEAVAAWLKRR